MLEYGLGGNSTFHKIEWTKQWGFETQLREMQSTALWQKQSKNFVYLRIHIRTNKGDRYTERDLGVMIAEDVKWINQINHVVNKANRMLGLLRRTFESRDSSLWKDLYLALIRPHLEYAVQTWNPHLIGDIEKLELVQRRDLKIPECFESLRYSERLLRLI